MTPDPNDSDRWREFFEATADREPRELLLQALKHVPAGEGAALDLGCGCGHDAVAMLRHGLRVTAVDAQPEAIQRTQRAAAAAAPHLESNLTTQCVAFEDLALPRAAFDFIYSGFALPFCAPAHFDRFWSMIANALAPGGILAGQLFGDRDQWARDPDHPARVFLPRAEVDRRLEGFKRILFDEVERDGVTATGGEKRWHVHHFIVRQSESSE